MVLVIRVRRITPWLVLCNFDEMVPHLVQGSSTPVYRLGYFLAERLLIYPYVVSKYSVRANSRHIERTPSAMIRHNPGVVIIAVPTKAPNSPLSALVTRPIFHVDYELDVGNNSRNRKGYERAIHGPNGSRDSRVSLRSNMVGT